VPAVDTPTVPEGAWIDRVAEATGDDAGQTLREWRRSTKTSQAEAARRLGMTQQNLSQIETGRHPMSYELRRRAVDELGITPSDLGLSTGHHQSSDRDIPAQVRESQARWRFERRWLNQHRSQLAGLASELYPAEHRLPGTPLIAPPEWVPSAPVDLRSLRLTLDEGRQPTAVDGTEDETVACRPLCKPDTRFASYTAAVKHVDPPRLFESRPSYRLLDADLAAGRMRFGLAAYFDKLDVSEAVGHELAAACLAHGAEPPRSVDALRDALPFRSLIGDPFAADRRAVIPAITTLTIRLRRYPNPPSFLLHWRDPAKVATAGGMYDVIPAGEFQPASVALWDRQNDFDLWRNIVREYSEELLGTPEHDGTRSRPIDYDGWPLYHALEDARSAGTLTSSLLGVGVDALTLAATILTVVVIDDDVFRRQFGSAGRLNEEGEMVGTGGGQPVEGLPFTGPVVERLLSSEPMASPGAACLALAWRHRDTILGQ
jgi:transcriptional regulator with XRE-family HTH domain